MKTISIICAATITLVAASVGTVDALVVGAVLTVLATVACWGFAPRRGTPVPMGRLGGRTLWYVPHE